MADTPETPAKRTLAAARAELRDELLREVGPDEDGDTAPLDERLLNLARAYTALGGDLELGPPRPPGAPTEPERMALLGWRAANEAGATTAICDAVADRLRAELGGGPA